MAPNGYGKTTIIKCLTGLEYFNGSITHNNSIENLRSESLVIWDDSPFYEKLSGINNISVFSEKLGIDNNELYKISNKYLSKEILDSKVETYSYGQRKKLSLILQRIMHPKLLIMDEISNGLDYDSIKDLKKELKENFKSEYIILSGHQFAFYEGIVDIVFVIKDKRIINVTEEYNCDTSLSDIYERYFANE